MTRKRRKRISERDKMMQNNHRQNRDRDREVVQTETKYEI